VHELPSLQLIGMKTQPLELLQLFDVQGLLSLHVMGV
jgi:hypothetical protein